MEIIGISGTAVLSLLLAIGCPAYAGQGHQGDRQDHNGTQQNSPAPQQRDDHRQAEQRRNQQPTAQQQPERDREQQRAQEARAPHQQDQQRPPRERAGSDRTSLQGRESVQNSWRQRQARNWPEDHRSWQQRGGYSGYRIPDNRFRGYFGQQHGFRVGRLPFLVVRGYPRFQYGGYWFSVVDPYPANWASNWYDTDDVYVGYLNDGYYLYNRKYPGIGLAVSVTF